MSDHEKLREAIKLARMVKAPLYTQDRVRCLTTHGFDLIIAAAESTLPRTKMVEVWHCEGSTKGGTPWVSVETDRTKAAAYAAKYRDDPNHCCIRVTGPWQQEVPA